MRAWLSPSFRRTDVCCMENLPFGAFTFDVDAPPASPPPRPTYRSGPRAQRPVAAAYGEGPWLNTDLSRLDYSTGNGWIEGIGGAGGGAVASIGVGDYVTIFKTFQVDASGVNWADLSDLVVENEGGITGDSFEIGDITSVVVAFFPNPAYAQGIRVIRSGAYAAHVKAYFPASTDGTRRDLMVQPVQSHALGNAIYSLDVTDGAELTVDCTFRVSEDQLPCGMEIQLRSDSTAPEDVILQYVIEHIA